MANTNYSNRENYDSRPEYVEKVSTYDNSSNYGPVLTGVVLTGLATLLGTWFMIKNLVPQNATVVKPVETKITTGVAATTYPINTELDYEILRAGGVDNFNKLNALYASDAYKTYMTQQTDAMIQQAQQTMGATVSSAGSVATGTTSSTASVAAATDDFTRGTLTDAQFKQLSDQARWTEGNASSKIVWFEFSDVECPFCKKLHQQGTVKDILSAYSGQIGYTMLHFPLTQIHATAEKGGETLECVYDMYKDKYASFKDAVFALDLSTKPSWDVLAPIITQQGMDVAKVKECVDSGKFASVVSAQQALGTSIFNIQGTPGNVLVNTQTKKYIIISGAYPTDSFKAAIEELLK